MGERSESSFWIHACYFVQEVEMNFILDSRAVHVPGKLGDVGFANWRFLIGVLSPACTSSVVEPRLDGVLIQAGDDGGTYAPGWWDIEMTPSWASFLILPHAPDHG